MDIWGFLSVLMSLTGQEWPEEDFALDYRVTICMYLAQCLASEDVSQYLWTDGGAHTAEFGDWR